jgi:hypothetical protein
MVIKRRLLAATVLPRVQNVNFRENAGAARRKAHDAASAVARVEAVLAREQFVIGQACREHDPCSV